MLAQFANAGQGQVSNRETAELLAELFIMYIHSVAKYMEEVINEEIVREVVELNFNSVEDFPRLKVRNLMAGFRIDRIMQALSQLVTMGAISKGPKLEEYSRSLVDIPPEVDLPEEDQASQGDTPVDQVDQQATDQQATDQQGGDNVEGQ
ncbi:MAG: hypothetical protein D6816_15375 [Bacteroidetes bacterium]|nr:MAG: hypothetical protein D6816_15375 [Bacteroidota bacterium]